MNINTGEIISPEMAAKLEELNWENFHKNFIPVESNEMTAKQKKTMQVSKHDNRSKLGKKFTAARYQRKRFWEK